MKRMSLPVVISAVLLASVGGAAEPDRAVSTRGIVDLVGAAENWTTEEFAQVAGVLNAPSYFNFPSSTGKLTVEHSTGMMRLGRGYGEVACSGATLARGAYWNFSQEPAFVRVGRSADAVEIPAGAVVLTGDLITDLGSVSGLPPSVAREHTGSKVAAISCGSGYYACCNFGEAGATMTAKCVSAALDTECVNAGGPGSIACSLSAP